MNKEILHVIDLNKSLKKYLDDLIDKKVVIGFSGGPDSVATYHIISDYFLSQGRDRKDIYLAHFNHQIRAESAHEEEYIKSHYDNVIIGHYQGTSSKEKELRDARHKFFQSALKQIESKTLILGHNLTDRIETTIMNLKRGAGLNGRINMRTIDLKSNFTILRPLLEIPKKEIQKYCDIKKYHYFIDHTNDISSISLRNAIRKSISHLKEQDFDTYKKQYQEREQQFDNIHTALRHIPLPRYFGFNTLYKIPKDIIIDQLIKILKHIKEYHEANSRYLEQLANFINKHGSGSKNLGKRILEICHDQVYLYEKNSQFDTGQVLSYWIQYDISKGRKAKDLRLVDLKHDAYKGKSINKRFINNKIPRFLRSLVPVVIDKHQTIHYLDNLITRHIHEGQYVKL